MHIKAPLHYRTYSAKSYITTLERACETFAPELGENAFRVLMRLLHCCSASDMFADVHVDCFHTDHAQVLHFPGAQG